VCCFLNLLINQKGGGREVKKKKDLNGMLPEDYAYYFLADARNNGWHPGLD
jgi:hypothetical protein